MDHVHVLSIARLLIVRELILDYDDCLITGVIGRVLFNVLFHAQGWLITIDVK